MRKLQARSASSARKNAYECLLGCTHVCSRACMRAVAQTCVLSSVQSSARASVGRRTSANARQRARAWVRSWVCVGAQLGLRGRALAFETWLLGYAEGARYASARAACMGEPASSDEPQREMLTERGPGEAC
eukprot:6176914-Pleurochrysis_carterae.AAC.1